MRKMILAIVVVISTSLLVNGCSEFGQHWSFWKKKHQSQEASTEQIPTAQGFFPEGRDGVPGGYAYGFVPGDQSAPITRVTPKENQDRYRNFPRRGNPYNPKLPGTPSLIEEPVR